MKRQRTLLPAAWERIQVKRTQVQVIINSVIYETLENTTLRRIKDLVLAAFLQTTHERTAAIKILIDSFVFIVVWTELALATFRVV